MRYTRTMPSEASTTIRRSNLFERREQPLKGLKLTSTRIIPTLERIASLRFATLKQLALLDGGSETNLGRHLSNLFDHQYIDRPDKQRHGYRVGENPPIAYRITRLGLNLLEEATALSIPHLAWSTKDQKAKPASIEHTLRTGDIVIGFSLDATRLGLKLFDHYQLLPFFPEETRAANSFKLIFDQSDSRAKALRRVIPDRLLNVQNDAARRNFAIECDMGTMSIIGLKQPEDGKFARKIAGYWHAFERELHTARWGFKSFRVVTVTTSPQRIDTMREAVRTIVGKDTKLFVFTTFQEYFSSSPLTSPIWQTSSGERTTLWDAA